jgi:hypothetical protein
MLVKRRAPGGAAWIKLAVLLCVWLWTPVAGAAARGDDTPVATAASGLIEGRYRIRGRNGEIVHDTVSGLEWQRCSLGQVWYGSTCNGEAKMYTWEETSLAGARARVGGWRLPTIKELQTLVYCSSGRPARFFSNSDVFVCQGAYQRPTIVDKAFPNTPSSYFWSASPYAGASGSAWYVDFRNGYGNWYLKSNSYRVRLVRGGQ